MNNYKLWLTIEIVGDLVIGFIALYYYLKFRKDKKEKTWAYINLAIIIISIIALLVAAFFLFRSSSSSYSY